MEKCSAKEIVACLCPTIESYQDRCRCGLLACEHARCGPLLLLPDSASVGRIERCRRWILRISGGLGCSSRLVVE